MGVSEQRLKFQCIHILWKYIRESQHVVLKMMDLFLAPHDCRVLSMILGQVNCWSCPRDGHVHCPGVIMFMYNVNP